MEQFKFLVRVPEVLFKVRTPTNKMPGYEWSTLSTVTMFKGKRVAFFAVPGAFTPTCSSTHLPGYEYKYKEFMDLGISEVYCLSVNDSFTMNAWFQSLGIENVKPIPDGNGEFTRKMGFLIEKSNLCMNQRSWRYSMIVSDGVVEMMWVEPGINDNVEHDPFVVSDATTMLNYLKEYQTKEK